MKPVAPERTSAPTPARLHQKQFNLLAYSKTRVVLNKAFKALRISPQWSSAPRSVWCFLDRLFQRPTRNYPIAEMEHGLLIDLMLSRRAVFASSLAWYEKPEASATAEPSH